MSAARRILLNGDLISRDVEGTSRAYLARFYPNNAMA